MCKTIAPIPTGLCCFLAVAALALSAASAEETTKKGKDVVVREITLKSPRGAEYKGATNPTKITSIEELKKVLHDEGQVAKQVDFTKEQCLFFAWRGSQGDKLSSKVEQAKEGPVVVFSYSVGRLDDLRPHYHLYAIPRKATWRVEQGRVQVGLNVKAGRVGSRPRDPGSWIRP